VARSPAKSKSMKKAAAVEEEAPPPPPYDRAEFGEALGLAAREVLAVELGRLEAQVRRNDSSHQQRVSHYLVQGPHFALACAWPDVGVACKLCVVRCSSS
jgi:hypothetical protein